MQLLLASLTQSHLYTVPNGYCLERCLIRYTGGKAIDQAEALSYWLNHVTVTPLLVVDDEVAALPYQYKCRHQKTVIQLPPKTMGVNIYIPYGNVINFHAEQVLYIP